MGGILKFFCIVLVIFIVVVGIAIRNETKRKGEEEHYRKNIAAMYETEERSEEERIAEKIEEAERREEEMRLEKIKKEKDPIEEEKNRRVRLFESDPAGSFKDYAERFVTTLLVNPYLDDFSSSYRLGLTKTSNLLKPLVGTIRVTQPASSRFYYTEMEIQFVPEDHRWTYDGTTSYLYDGSNLISVEPTLVPGFPLYKAIEYAYTNTPNP